MSQFLLLASLFCSSFAFATNTDLKKQDAAAECVANNKVLAQSMFDNAAKRIGFDASEVSLKWTSAGLDRYVFSGYIYKAEYEIVVKTDTGCFPHDVELIDLATR